MQQAASSILAMLQRSSGPLVESQIRCCWCCAGCGAGLAGQALRGIRCLSLHCHRHRAAWHLLPVSGAGGWGLACGLGFNEVWGLPPLHDAVPTAGHAGAGGS